MGRSLLLPGRLRAPGGRPGPNLATAAECGDDDARANPIAAAIGAASADLARSFILAAQGDAGRREAMHETLLARLTAYVRAHLTDADLSPARIAAHHHISVRHLHTVWSSGTGSTLEQWIMMERLAGARDQLATGRSITALAHE